MKAIDVLYTPLDCPPQPNFDLAKLKAWLSENYSKQEPHRKFLSSNNKTAEDLIDNYPWNLTIAFHNYTDKDIGWYGNFDREFPELSKWMVEAFGLDINDIGLIILLPVRDLHTGLGFWHNDVDSTGLRFYLEFEDPVHNKLFIKGTKIKHDTRPQFKLPIDIDVHLQEKTTECKLLSNKQCFYLNNIRACHSTWTEVADKTRIAAFVVAKDGKEEKMMKDTERLIVDSALKYSDYSVLWEQD